MSQQISKRDLSKPLDPKSTIKIYPSHELVVEARAPKYALRNTNLSNYNTYWVVGVDRSRFPCSVNQNPSHLTAIHP
jgi:hypothetical protein